MADVRDWTPAPTFDDFASTCCHHPRLNLLTDPESFSLTQRDSILNQPLVGPSFVDAVVRGFLLNRAVEIIEEEAYLPLTVSSIAARNYISVRALQRGFRTIWAYRRRSTCVRFGCATHIGACSCPTRRRSQGKVGRLRRPQPEWAGFGRLVRSYIGGHKGERARYVTERTSMTGRRHRALKSL